MFVINNMTVDEGRLFLKTVDDIEDLYVGRLVQKSDFNTRDATFFYGVTLGHNEDALVPGEHIILCESTKNLIYLDGHVLAGKYTVIGIDKGIPDYAWEYVGAKLIGEGEEVSDGNLNIAFDDGMITQTGGRLWVFGDAFVTKIGGYCSGGIDYVV